MLPKYFSYYNYKITQNIDIPILFFVENGCIFDASVVHCRITVV